MNYLLLLAVVPSIFLFVFVYKHDRVEKEPFLLLLGLFLVGATFVVGGALWAGDVLEKAFDGMFEKDSLQDLLFTNFILAGLVEETCKFVFLYFLTFKNKNFNSLFDGMIYAVCVSLGFATLENVLYVIDGGLSIGIARAILSVPGHCFYGIIMGYYYSLYHVNKIARKAEKRYAKKGIIKVKIPIIYRSKLCLALLIPAFLHGLYDFCVSNENIILILFALVLVASLYVICFRRVRYFSKLDKTDKQYVAAMLAKKYPELKSFSR